MAKQSGPKQGKPPPRCKAILLCDHVLVESSTRKISIIGIIRILQGLVIPGQTSPIKIFLQMVDGIGRYDLTVEVHDLAEDKIIAKGKGPSVFFPDPLTVRELILRIRPIPIAHPGSYDAIVFANGQEIDRQQFTVADSESRERDET